MKDQLQAKLESLKSQNDEFAQRHRVAEILQEGKHVSAHELETLGGLRKNYGALLQAIANADIAALTKAGRTPKEPMQADEILKEMAANEKHHRELQTMAADTASHPERRVGDATTIEAMIEAGKGMAERLTARIQKLAGV